MKKQILTKRLVLRPLNKEDLQETFSIAQDAEATRYMMFYPHRNQRETALFLEKAWAEFSFSHERQIQKIFCRTLTYLP